MKFVSLCLKGTVNVPNGSSLEGFLTGISVTSWSKRSLLGAEH